MKNKMKRKTAQVLVATIMTMATTGMASKEVSAPTPERGQEIISLTDFGLENATKVVKQAETAKNIQAEVVETDISLGVFKITAYCPCEICSEGYGHQTATQTRCTEGRTVAVDPNVIPLGTTIIIDGQEYVAEDVGGDIKEKRIDIFLEDHQATKKFGVQYLEVKIKDQT